MVTPSDEHLDKHEELAALFRAGLSGETASYSLFLQKISVILRRTIGKRLPANDVEDVLQDILISVHKARHTYDGQRPLMPWLFAIARFRINDYLRKLYARVQREIDIQPFTEALADTDDVTDAYGNAESLERLLKDVPDRQRRILTMMYVEGHTARETGRKLGMKESAVKVAAFRAIRLIRKRLGA